MSLRLRCCAHGATRHGLVGARGNSAAGRGHASRAACALAEAAVARGCREPALSGTWSDEK